MSSSVASMVSTLPSLASIHNVMLQRTRPSILIMASVIIIKKLKSCRTGLTGYYGCISCKLLLMPSG